MSAILQKNFRRDLSSNKINSVTKGTPIFKSGEEKTDHFNYRPRQYLFYNVTRKFLIELCNNRLHDKLYM